MRFETFRHLKKFICVVLIAALMGSSIAPGAARAASTPGVGEQIATDLLAGGVSLAAAMTGNVPLAMAAGFLTKYITTYGVRGIKSLIDFFKGYRPRDLGEINLYYIYLLEVKRNLYQTLITIRKSTEREGAFETIGSELDRVEAVLKGECTVEGGCQPTGLNESLVNYSFLNIILDAKQSIDISKYLSANEVKDTYQYLMLLYMDLIIVEQKLLEAQYDLLASRTQQTLEILKKNPYLSNAEKEFQGQMLLSLSLRWLHLTDTRRVVIASALRNPLALLEKENGELADEIDRYRHKPGKAEFGFLKDDSQDKKYEEYMQQIQKDLQRAGIQVDAFDQNPFQTGTALSGYYLGEKTLLLERDAFFQMKANKLKTTEEVADFHHRTKILRSHANNMLLQLVQAVDQRNHEGFGAIEKPKQQIELDKLIEECKKDAACVADRLKNPETSVRNILVDNFNLATQIFGQIPYMHVLEVNAVYQLIQLIYLEVFYSQNMLSLVEFDLFLKKQRSARRAIAENDGLTQTEKRLHTAMVENTVSKWKKRILERKFDHTSEFETKAAAIKEANQEIFNQLRTVRLQNPDVFKGLYEKKSCFNFTQFQEWRRCKSRKALTETLGKMAAGTTLFLGDKEEKIPAKFWKSLGSNE